MPAPKGNRYGEKYSLEQALDIFEKTLEYAQNDDDCLSMQDAVIFSGIPSRTFYDLCEKHEALQYIKKDINDSIISKINRSALRNKFNATASIWRMKQLGETDRQDINIGGQDSNPLTIKIGDQEFNV